MRILKYTYWRDDEYFLGYLNNYPPYETQGSSKEELEGNLKGLLDDIESGQIPFVRKVEDLVIA